MLFSAIWECHRLKYRAPRRCVLTKPGIQADLVIDVVGLKCPLPVLKLKKRIELLAPGALVHLLTSDPTTLGDVPNYCALMGHEVLAIEDRPPTYTFWIRLKPSASGCDG